MSKHNIRLWGTTEFKNVEKRLIYCRAIERLPQNAKTVLFMLFPYKIKERPHNISRYAFSRDYHIIIKKLLSNISSDFKNKFPDYNFSCFCDNSPIPEVYGAALSGLGALGDNGLLISKEYGSWVFIGEIVTDMYISLTNKTEKIDECCHCGKCKNMCIGGVISSEGFDKDSCVSNITQKKGKLSDKEKDLIIKGGLVWGCDVCQECCPLNRNAKETYIEDFKEEVSPVITEGDYEKLKDRAFHFRHGYIINRNLSILKSDKDIKRFGGLSWNKR